MILTIELPEDLSSHSDPSRDALEALAIEAYRSGALTHSQSGRLLGLSRAQFDDFLIERRILDHAYLIGDLNSFGDPGRSGHNAASLPGRDRL